MNEAIILACGWVSFVIESLIVAHRLVFSFFEGIVLAILSLALVSSACGHMMLANRLVFLVRAIKLPTD